MTIIFVVEKVEGLQTRSSSSFDDKPDYKEATLTASYLQGGGGRGLSAYHNNRGSISPQCCRLALNFELGLPLVLFQVTTELWVEPFI